MYRVQTAAYSRYITAFTINGTYETKPIREKPNETQIERNNFFFLFFHVFFTGDYFLFLFFFLRLVQKLKVILFKSKFGGVGKEIIRKKRKLTWKTIIGGSEFCQCQKNYVLIFVYRWKMKNKKYSKKMFSIKFN